MAVFLEKPMIKKFQKRRAKKIQIKLRLFFTLSFISIRSTPVMTDEYTVS